MSIATKELTKEQYDRIVDNVIDMILYCDNATSIENVRKLENRIDELETALGSLMKKFRMTEYYKGPKLLYRVKNDEDKIEYEVNYRNKGSDKNVIMYMRGDINEWINSFKECHINYIHEKKD